ETAVIRLADADPDLILADVFLPVKSGYELCELVKSHPRHRHARVVLLAGPLDPVDEQEMRRVGADGLLRKPLEASAVLETVRPLIEAARSERDQRPACQQEALNLRPQTAPAPRPQGPDPERVRAAVTLALDAALPALVEQISQRLASAVAPALDAALPEMIEELTGKVLAALNE
ncbi:MAG: response regulator, partial [Bryobacterales bacterium]|nr:response regulator [Bryobacteraceae bacterium]MDW8131812.1 response regulator [Bryobacterales bacterium]